MPKKTERANSRRTERRCGGLLAAAAIFVLQPDLMVMSEVFVLIGVVTVAYMLIGALSS